MNSAGRYREQKIQVEADEGTSSNLPIPDIMEQSFIDEVSVAEEEPMLHIEEEDVEGLLPSEIDHGHQSVSEKTDNPIKQSLIEEEIVKPGQKNPLENIP